MRDVTKSLLLFLTELQENKIKSIIQKTVFPYIYFPGLYQL